MLTVHVVSFKVRFIYCRLTTLYFFPFTMIIVSPLLLALLPFVTASRLHKLKLHKLTPAANNPALESAYLAEKYGASPQIQMPLMGLGGSGRRLERPTRDGDEQLFWTQEELKGGHNVPLSSLLHTFGFVSPS